MQLSFDEKRFTSQETIDNSFLTILPPILF